MFNNYQEHYERSEESRFNINFSAFSPMSDRVRLVASGILIPITCSFFYFLQTGQKYTEFEMAINKIDKLQLEEINNESIAGRGGQAESVLLISNEHNNTVLNTNHDKLIKSTELESIGTDTVDPRSDEQTVADKNITQIVHNKLSKISQNGMIKSGSAKIQTDDQAVIKQLTSTNNQADRLQTASSNSDQSIPFKNTGIINKTENDNFNLTAGHSESANLFVISDQSSTPQAALKEFTNEDQNSDPDSLIGSGHAKEPANDKKIQEEQSKIALVDKIIGLLKSEIISTNSTADTGKPKPSSKHIRNPKKSLDTNKLESMLGAI